MQHALAFQNLWNLTVDLRVLTSKNAAQLVDSALENACEFKQS